MSQSCGSTDSRCYEQILGREVKEEYTRTSEKLKCKWNAMELGTDQRVEFAKESSSTVGVDRRLSESRISRCSTNVRLTIQLMQMRRAWWNLCMLDDVAIHSDILVMVKNFANQLRKRLVISDLQQWIRDEGRDKEVAKMSGYFNARWSRRSKTKSSEIWVSLV